MKAKITNSLNQNAMPTWRFGTLMVLFFFLFLNGMTFAQDGQYVLGNPMSVLSSVQMYPEQYKIGLTPFQCATRDTRNQYLYLGQELQNQLTGVDLVAGTGYITSLAFNVTALPSQDNIDYFDTKIYNITISLRATNATSLTGTILSTDPALTIYCEEAELEISKLGWVTFDLTKKIPGGFFWAGNTTYKNIIVEICQNSKDKALFPPYLNLPYNFEVQTSRTSFRSNNAYYSTDNALSPPFSTPGCEMLTVTTGPDINTPGTSKGVNNATWLVRPDIQFTFACSGYPTPAGTAGLPVTVPATTLIKCIGEKNILYVNGGDKHSMEYEWQTSETGGAGPWIISDSTNATYTAVKSDVNMWYRRRNVCGASDNYSSTLMIPQKTWTGSAWINSSDVYGNPNVDPNAPNSLHESAVFDGDWEEGDDLKFCSMIVKSGNVVISSGNNVELENGVQVTGGSLTFESSIVINETASLIQNDKDAVNFAYDTDKIIFQRATTPVRRYDYTYWSSPVADQSLVDLSPDTLWDKFFSYSGTAWVNENSSNLMTIGKGYIARAPQGHSITVGSKYLAEFKGIPNNGDIILDVDLLVSGPDNYYLIGNPYPSALDADAFLTANSSILQGTLYFWAHNTALANNQYNEDDYACYNKTGGVGTYPAKLPIPNQPLGANNNSKPLGEIASGQGFMATPVYGSNSDIVFNNSMRIATATQNNQFYKTANSENNGAVKDKSIEKNRIWLELTNDMGAFKQTLLGYVTGATLGYDNGFDGENINSNDVNLFSIIDNHQLTIQGRGLPFENSDTVPLGFTAKIAGNHTVTLAEYDGLFESQEVYLEDTYLNIIHNLKSSNYNFVAEKGTFLDRFVLRFTENTLNLNPISISDNDIVAFNKSGSLVVNAGNTNIQSIKVYDLRGRLVLKKNNCQSANVIFEKSNWNAQLMLVKIITEDKVEVTRKVLF